MQNVDVISEAVVLHSWGLFTGIVWHLGKRPFLDEFFLFSIYWQNLRLSYVYVVLKLYMQSYSDKEAQEDISETNFDLLISSSGGHSCLISPEGESAGEFSERETFPSFDLGIWRVMHLRQSDTFVLQFFYIINEKGKEKKAKASRLM